jgi:hypothetical protein
MNTYTATTVPTQFVEADGIRLPALGQGPRRGFSLVEGV